MEIKSIRRTVRCPTVPSIARSFLRDYTCQKDALGRHRGVLFPFYLPWNSIGQMNAIDIEKMVIFLPQRHISWGQSGRESNTSTPTTCPSHQAIGSRIPRCRARERLPSQGAFLVPCSAACRGLGTLHVTPSLNPSPRGRDSAAEAAVRLTAQSLRSLFPHRRQKPYTPAPRIR